MDEDAWFIVGTKNSAFVAYRKGIKIREGKSIKIDEAVVQIFFGEGPIHVTVRS